MNAKIKNNITYVIGIDQTGAIDGKGKPKTLPCAIKKIYPNEIIKVNLSLRKLGSEEILSIIREQFPEYTNEKTLIMVDAALGAPKILGLPIRKIIEHAHTFNFENQSYGMKTANKFYEELKGNTHAHLRTVDALAGAQSVFTPFPFQKNIACGTFRILKDIANDPNFSIWPFEKLDKKSFIIAEGYPSLYWEKLFQSKRKSDILSGYLTKKYRKKYVLKNQDCADAAIMAEYVSTLDINMILNKKKTPTQKKEGWIIGI